MAVSSRRGQLYYDKVLTNLAPQYANQMTNFIADQIAPTIWTEKQSKAMYTFDLQDTDTVVNDKVAPGTEPNSIDSFSFTILIAYNISVAISRQVSSYSSFSLGV